MSFLAGGEVASGGTLSLSATGGGTLTAEPAEGSYPDGTVVTVTASAPEGLWLQAWGGAVPAHERWTGRGSQQVTVTGAVVVSAQFGTAPPVRFFKTGGDGFRAERLSPTGRFAMGAHFPVAGAFGKPAFRDRGTRTITTVSTNGGRMRALSADGLRGAAHLFEGSASSVSWTPQGEVPADTHVALNDISRDGSVVGASRFAPGNETVTFGPWREVLPFVGHQSELYGAMSGDGRFLYSFISSTKLITHDGQTSSRTESDLPTGWSFYPYNAALNFPAGCNYDGTVLAATFATGSGTQAAVFRNNTWTPLPGGANSAVFRVSGNGTLAIGYTGGEFTRVPAIWKLNGAEPVLKTVAEVLGADGAWVPPLTIRGVDDVSDDGTSFLVHEESGPQPWPWSGWDANWIAVRAIFLEQSITFNPPAQIREDAWRLPLTAVSTSGLPVTITLESGPGSIVNGFYYPSGPGTAVLTARQAGGDNFTPAPDVVRTLTILPDDAAPVIHLDHADAFSVNEPAGAIRGTVADSAEVIHLELKGTDGTVLLSLDLAPGEPFNFPNLDLVPGANTFKLSAKGGNLMTERTIVITWQPDHLFRLAGADEAPEGRTLPLRLEMVSRGGVMAMDWELTYPMQRFHLPVLVSDPALAPFRMEVTVNVPGRMVCTFSAPGIPLPAGTHSMGTVLLRPRSVGTAAVNTSVGLTVSRISDDEGNPITTSLQAQGRALLLLPRAHTGDVNNNGRLDVGDARFLQRFLAGLETPQPWDGVLNDLNASGALDAGDVTKLMRVAAFLDPNIPPTVPPMVPAVPAGEVITLAILNPGARPGDVLQLEVRTGALMAPVSGTAFMLEYPAGLLEPEGVLPVTPGPLVPAGVAQRTGNSAGAGGAPSRLTWAASSVQAFGTAGQPLVLAGVSMRVRPEAATLTVLPIRLASLSFASGDGFDISDAAAVSAFYRPAGARFVDWGSNVFSPVQLADPLVSGFDADPDGDGMANGLEFHLGGSPLDGRAPQAPEIFAGADGFVRLRYAESPAITGSTLAVEWTETLHVPGSWRSSGVILESSVPGNDGTVVNTVKIPAETATSPHLWLRLKAVVQPNG